MINRQLIDHSDEFRLIREVAIFGCPLPFLASLLKSLEDFLGGRNILSEYIPNIFVHKKWNKGPECRPCYVAVMSIE